MTEKLIKLLSEVHEQYKARGNFGHSGRPGKVGGSTKGGSVNPSMGHVPQKINGVPLADDAKQLYTKVVKKYTAMKWYNKFSSHLYNNAGGRKQITAADVQAADEYTQKLIAESKK